MNLKEIFDAVEPILMEHYAYRKDKLSEFTEETPLYYNFDLEDETEGVHPSKEKPMLIINDIKLYPGTSGFPNSAFAAMSVIMDCEQLFGIEISDREAENIQTVGELISFIQRKIA